MKITVDTKQDHSLVRYTIPQSSTPVDFQVVPLVRPSPIKEEDPSPSMFRGHQMPSTLRKSHVRDKDASSSLLIKEPASSGLCKRLRNESR